MTRSVAFAALPPIESFLRPLTAPQQPARPSANAEGAAVRDAPALRALLGGPPKRPRLEARAARAVAATPPKGLTLGELEPLLATPSPRPPGPAYRQLDRKARVLLELMALAEHGARTGETARHDDQVRATARKHGVQPHLVTSWIALDGRLNALGCALLQRWKHWKTDTPLAPCDAARMRAFEHRIAQPGNASTGASDDAVIAFALENNVRLGRLRLAFHRNGSVSETGQSIIDAERCRIAGQSSRKLTWSLLRNLGALAAQGARLDNDFLRGVALLEQINFRTLRRAVREGRHLRAAPEPSGGLQAP
jgi:hypothetical protein